MKSNSKHLYEKRSARNRERVKHVKLLLELEYWISQALESGCFSLECGEIGFMFQPVKQTFKTSSKIQTLIKDIYKNGYSKRFNPCIYKKMGIEVDEKKWMKTISKLVKSGQVTEALELTCPNCHEIIYSYTKYQDIPLDQTIECIHCTHEFEVSEEHVIPMYAFSDEFDPMQELSMSENYSSILAKKD
jgi:DNA-directed RNA polymerase subunit M/transcription elongation factor TFIIS